jgi:hypothetical protein
LRDGSGAPFLAALQFPHFLEHTEAYRGDLRRLEYGDDKTNRDFLAAASAEFIETYMLGDGAKEK